MEWLLGIPEGSAFLNMENKRTPRGRERNWQRASCKLRGHWPGRCCDFAERKLLVLRPDSVLICRVLRITDSMEEFMRSRFILGSGNMGSELRVETFIVSSPRQQWLYLQMDGW